MSYLNLFYIADVFPLTFHGFRLMADSRSKEKTLLVFDFDHTLIDDNVDTSVCKLAPGGDIPDSVRSLYSDDGWIEFMGAVFRHLHQNGVSAEKIEEHVKSLPLAPGMKELFEHIRNTGKYDTIIISDANTVFINYLLEHRNLDSLVSKVFTNPAKYSSDGCLMIENYHTQDWCSLSTVNLCKGHILQDYIQSCGKEGVSYSRVVYVGDGSNDLCPGLTLRPQDYLMPRKGFSLWKKLEKMRVKQGTPGKQIVATVIGWDSGVEVRTLLENIAVDKPSL